MTVGELINELEGFDKDLEIVIKPSNSIYAEGIRGTHKVQLRSPFGENRNVLVITSVGQEGAV